MGKGSDIVMNELAADWTQLGLVVTEKIQKAPKASVQNKVKKHKAKTTRDILTHLAAPRLFLNSKTPHQSESFTTT